MEKSALTVWSEGFNTGQIKALKTNSRYYDLDIYIRTLISRSLCKYVDKFLKLPSQQVFDLIVERELNAKS